MGASRPGCALVLGALVSLGAGAQERADLAPRVPAAALAAARRLANPVPATSENLAKGKVLYLGRGFCATCHGRDGRGLGPDVDTAALRGALPRDFTDPAWQRARSDGELLWILHEGSPGTAMAPFVPRVLSEREAWQVLLYVRALGQRPLAEAAAR